AEANEQQEKKEQKRFPPTAICIKTKKTPNFTAHVKLGVSVWQLAGLQQGLRKQTGTLFDLSKPVNIIELHFCAA
ncbi:MAG: hypothetical protein Q4C37_08630, partial [Bacteroidales bacterium]|nr:hypothetical protein [Bacteroidales bacterium]